MGVSDGIHMRTVTQALGENSHSIIQEYRQRTQQQAHGITSHAKASENVGASALDRETGDWAVPPVPASEPFTSAPIPAGRR
jgi:hypothetical protein